MTQQTRLLSLHTQHGQATLEYVIVCAALAFALSVGMGDEESALKQLLNAFKTAYQNFSHAISLPS